MTKQDELLECLACKSKKLDKVIETKTMMSIDSKQWSFVECRECKLIMLNPRVLMSELGEYYKDYYLPYRGAVAWGKYASLVEKDQKKIDKIRSQTVKKYSKLKNGVVLDVGCGKPTFLKEVTSQANLKGIGIDFSDHGWSLDRDNYMHLQLLVGEVGDLDSSIIADTVTMWHYLEHDYDPQSTLNALHNHTHTDSRLIIEVPNHESSTRKKYGNNWAGYHSPRHTGLYDLDNMETLLNKTGWKVVDKYAHGSLDPYVLDWMSRMEIKNIDWSEGMEQYFVSFVMGKILRPWYFFPKLFSQGFMTFIAEPI